MTRDLRRWMMQEGKAKGFTEHSWLLVFLPSIQKWAYRKHLNLTCAMGMPILLVASLTHHHPIILNSGWNHLHRQHHVQQLHLFKIKHSIINYSGTSAKQTSSESCCWVTFVPQHSWLWILRAWETTKRLVCHYLWKLPLWIAQMKGNMWDNMEVEDKDICSSGQHNCRVKCQTCHMLVGFQQTSTNFKPVEHDQVSSFIPPH